MNLVGHLVAKVHCSHTVARTIPMRMSWNLASQQSTQLDTIGTPDARRGEAGTHRKSINPAARLHGRSGQVGACPLNNADSLWPCSGARWAVAPLYAHGQRNQAAPAPLVRGRPSRAD
jgi:hypothetical protein